MTHPGSHFIACEQGGAGQILPVLRHEPCKENGLDVFFFWMGIDG
jgi:hypothetical protein